MKSATSSLCRLVSSPSAAALLAASALALACSEEGSGSTSRSRVSLTVSASSPPGARVSFVNAYQWSITLSRADIAVGELYFFDGAPIFSQRAVSLPSRLAGLFVGVAHAHPGHYLAGNAVGQMLTASSFSLLGEGAVLGTGDGVTGDFRSARVTFPAAVTGAAAGALGDNIAVAEGRAVKDGKTVGFRVAAKRGQLIDASGEARVEGCAFAPEGTISGDRAIVLTIDPRVFFDQADFEGLPDNPSPVDLPADSDAATNFVRGVKKGAAYVFTIAP